MAMEVDQESGLSSDLNILAGVIKADEEIRMKRMIFRISRGRAIPQFFDFNSDSEILKKIFIIFFQGQEDSFLKNKLTKISDIFNASRYKNV